MMIFHHPLYKIFDRKSRKRYSGIDKCRLSLLTTRESDLPRESAQCLTYSHRSLLTSRPRKTNQRTYWRKSKPFFLAFIEDWIWTQEEWTPGVRDKILVWTSRWGWIALQRLFAGTVYN